MSFGGHVSTMISSLRNNRRLLSPLKQRRKYAMEHHAEEKVREKLKDQVRDPRMVAKIREEAIREFKAELRIQKVIILGIIILAIITFSYLFSFLSVIEK